MFYLREFFFRVKYSLIAFLILCGICFKNKAILFILITFPTVSEQIANSYTLTHFIYTHPVELFNIYILLILFTSLIFLLPLLMWQIFDFLKSSFYEYEAKRFRTLSILIFNWIWSLNFFCFIIILPKIWKLFTSFNYYAGIDQSINFFFELKVNDFFLFIYSFFYYLNILFTILFLVYCFINYLGLKELIKRKKLFIFLNMVFATLLSPPDVYSQILIFLILSSLFEILIFLYIIILKLKKFYKN